jgi:hypothetical protein
MFIGKTKCEHNANKFPILEGELIMTNYKLVFKPFANVAIPLPKYLTEFLKVPLSYILKLDKTTIEKKASKISTIEIYTKDSRYMKLIFDNFDECNNTMLRIQFLAHPDNEMLNLFTFDYLYPVPASELFEDGWDIYKDAKKEF